MIAASSLLIRSGANPDDDLDAVSTAHAHQSDVLREALS